MRRRVAEGLVEPGILAEERSRLLGLIERARYPPARPETELALRARLREKAIRKEGAVGEAVSDAVGAAQAATMAAVVAASAAATAGGGDGGGGDGG